MSRSVSVRTPYEAADSVGGTSGADRRSSRPAVGATRSAWVCFVSLTVLIGVHATGIAGQVLYPVVTASATVAAFVGPRRLNVVRRWPWSLLIVVGGMWTVSGIAREVTGATGDLSSSRSLLPDLFALPGYVLFGIALSGLVRVRGTVRNRGVLIDAALVAVGSSAVVFSTVITPTLSIEDSWVWARLAVAVYPAASMCMLIGVVQLTLMRPRGVRAFVFVLAGAACLQIGDVFFALGEVGRIDLPGNVLDIPYLAMAACLASAALHPGVHRIDEVSPLDAGRFNSMRLLAVTLALVAPVVAIAASSDRGAGRPLLIGLLAVSGVLAVTRIAVAARAENTARRELFHRATHDQLTGLPSRELLLDHATALLDNPGHRPVALMFLDLDEFKLVNDSLGHAAGDLLLMQVGQRLADTVRDTDVVGRIGGDEFVIITADLDATGAQALADRIRRKLRNPFHLVADEVFISTSIGITIAEPGTTAATMMQEADTAMYRSKSRGRNHATMFDPSMRDSVQRRVQLEQGLRRALANNEISVAFQPIIDTTAQRVEGFEALMRWSTADANHPPASFMDVAEDSGLIVSLGEFVLNEACRQVAYWRRVIPGCEDLTVSVNLSARQIQTSNVVDVVANALDTHQLPGEALWLEITESVMLDDTVTTTAVMNGLRALGVRLAVDDFGTGFSSLSYLRTFPVSRVKIDRSFITDLSSDPASEALVRAVVGIGAAMHLEVVAEGVETADQAQRLADLACTQIQGYLYSRPVSAAQVPAVLDRIETGRATMPQTRRVGRGVRCRP